jgi:hypothetical protein
MTPELAEKMADFALARHDTLSLSAVLRYLSYGAIQDRFAAFRELSVEEVGETLFPTSKAGLMPHFDFFIEALYREDWTDEVADLGLMAATFIKFCDLKNCYNRPILLWARRHHQTAIVDYLTAR